MDRRVSTQDVSWFLDLHSNMQLDLDPPYQRRSVWSRRDRRFFLDTILRGYPSPSIFLHKSARAGADRHVYEVVDGKQRLETILMFVSNEIALAKDFGDRDLDGKKWLQLSPDQKSRLWDYVLPVEFIRLVEGTVVNQVFDRLNRNARRLEAQELRHARFDGWFVTFVETEVEAAFWQDLGVSTKARAKRMKDVQFVSELLMIILTGRIHGFDHENLDELYADYETIEDAPEEVFDDEFRTRVESTKAFLSSMESANGCITSFGKNYKDFYSLWSVTALNSANLGMPERVAERYIDFMKKVDELKGQDDLEEFLRNQNTAAYSLAHKYLINATGASTELAQRQPRHDVLVSVLSEPT